MGPSEDILPRLPETNGSIFYYFAYGSDMHLPYLQKSVPNSRIIGTALLRYHRLDFNSQSTRWGGAIATIVIDGSCDIYGVLFEIKLTDIFKLDELFGVKHKLYIQYRTPVILVKDRRAYIVRTYYLRNQPLRSLYEFKKNEVPLERLPSKTYLKFMIKGALDAQMPNDYLIFLSNMKHNGVIKEDLERTFNLTYLEI